MLLLTFLLLATPLDASLKRKDILAPQRRSIPCPYLHNWVGWSSAPAKLSSTTVVGPTTHHPNTAAAMRMAPVVFFLAPCVALAQPAPKLRNSGPAALPHATSYAEFWGAYAGGEQDLLATLQPGMILQINGSLCLSRHHILSYYTRLKITHA